MHDEWQTIETIDRGAEKAVPDVVIWCPHASNAEPFLSSFPEIRESIVANDETLLRFLDLEQDQGSDQLALAIADALAAQSSDQLAIRVIYARLPRGIIDPARSADFAIRNIFHDELDGSLLQVMRILHESIIRRISEQVLNLDPINGYFMEVHTMAPYSPTNTPFSDTKAILETPKALEPYIQAYINAPELGERRDIAVITSTSDGEYLADEHLTQQMVAELQQADYKFHYNNPYKASRRLIGGILMSQRRAVALDVPKDLLTKQPAESPDFNLLNLDLDAGNIQRLANTVVKGLLAPKPPIL